VTDQPQAAPPPPFIVAGYHTDATLPPTDEPFTEFGPALDRALIIGSTPGYRSAVVMDQHNMVYVQINMLWSIPRGLR
jgi:hypothetical protein